MARSRGRGRQDSKRGQCRAITKNMKYEVRAISGDSIETLVVDAISQVGRVNEMTRAD